MHSNIIYKMQCEDNLASELTLTILAHEGFRSTIGSTVNTTDTCFGFIHLVNFVKFCHFYPGILLGNIKSLMPCLDDKLSWL
jgi:hypothetical protein